jgi:hypothetical protein
MVYVLVYSAPGFAVFNSVLPRDGSGAVRPMPLRRRQDLKRAPVHQTQHPLPRTRVGRAAPPGGRRRASRRLYSVRTPRGWLGPARGEFLCPQIRRWYRRRCCWRISGPPGGPEIRWILSVGWCPSKRMVVIHRARPYTAQKASGGPGTAILNY